MPKEKRLDLGPGEVARIFSTERLSGGINKGTAAAPNRSATIRAAGTYVEPLPPVEPPPGARPFPAPNTVRTIQVPASVTTRAGLQAFYATVPDGSIIDYRPIRYTLDGGMAWDDRKDIRHRANGANLHSIADGAQAASPFFAHRSWDCSWEGFLWTGVNPTPGHMSPQGEFSSPIHAMGGGRLELAGGTVRGVHGDGSVTANVDVRGVWVHDMDIQDCGRNAMSVVYGSDIWVQRNKVGPCGWYIFDIETEKFSNVDTSGKPVVMRNMNFLDNDCDTWTSTTPAAPFRGAFFAAVQGDGSTAVIDGIRVKRNRVRNNTIQSYIGWRDGGRRLNVEFEDNIGKAGPILGGAPALVWFHRVDGGRAKRNGLAPTNGPLYAKTESTDVEWAA